MNKQLIRKIGYLCVGATTIGVVSSIIGKMNDKNEKSFDVVDVEENFHIINFDSPVKLRDIRDVMSTYIYEHNIDPEKEVTQVILQTTED